MSRTDDELVDDAIEHFRMLRRHLERADLDNQTVADAVSLRLASAIECIASGSPELRDRIFGDDWHAAWSTRNRIAHGYSDVDPEIIRVTVERDLPRIERALLDEHRS